MDAAIEVKIALAEFEETTERPERLQAALHRLAAERVEDDVDPLPASEVAHGIAKTKIARIEHVIGASQTQECSLHLRTGCGGNDRAAVLGVLDRGKPHTAGSSVNEDMLPGFELCQAPQSIY